VLAVLLAMVFGGINLAGAKSAGRAQLVLVAGLLMILLWFSGGLMHMEPSHFAGFFDKGMDAMLAAAGLVYISYVGVTKVASVSEEVKDPERNLPLGITLAFLTALIIYLIGTTVMVGVLPMNELAGHFTPVAAAADRLVGPWGRNLIVIAALFAFSAVANAGILSSSRYPLAMSRDGLMPSFFGVFTKKGIPVYGVAATVGLMLLVIALLEPVKIAKLASAFQLLVFALICLAVIVMRESQIASYDPGFRSPGYPWMQIAGMILPFVLIAKMGWVSIVFTFGLIGAGAGWFRYYGRGRVLRQGAVFHVFERLGHRRYDGLDVELRGILKEKGLRKEDPFDEIVARAHVINAAGDSTFEEIAKEAAKWIALRAPVDAEHILDGFLKGTRIGATPVSRGAALPHLRLAGLAQPEMVIARVRQPLAINAHDAFGDLVEEGQSAYAIYFLVSPQEAPGQHLRILAQIAERVDDETFIEEWLAAEDEQGLKECLLRDERHVSIRLAGETPSASWIGAEIRNLHLPAGCLIALIRREGFTFVPRATTRIALDDRLTVIGEPDRIRELKAMIGE
jgi:mannitol/fructose-specific phosphotransferase system IIA component (Ntr-type)